VFICFIYIKKKDFFVNITHNSVLCKFSGSCFKFLTWFNMITIFSPHDEHRSSGPRPVNLCSDQYIFQYIKINSNILFGPVNSNFHFEDCILGHMAAYIKPSTKNQVRCWPLNRFLSTQIYRKLSKKYPSCNSVIVNI
jgi:hypothetical protein